MTPGEDTAIPRPAPMLYAVGMGGIRAKAPPGLWLGRSFHPGGINELIPRLLCLCIVDEDLIGVHVALHVRLVGPSVVVVAGVLLDGV